MNREAAKSVAAEALSFLAGDLERLGHFLALTGIDPAEIRAVARDSGFLAAVLDHVAGDESLLHAFAREAGRDPAEVAAAHATLADRPWERDIP